MIEQNAALYIGIVTACVLDQFPEGVVVVERTGIQASAGYRVRGSRSTGAGSERRNFQADHLFLEAQTRGAASKYLVDAARLAGDSIVAQLHAAV